MNDSSISKALHGFKRDKSNKGFEIYTVDGWDYQSLIQIYEHSSNFCRENHIPILIHVKNLTQPIGHSTSGSHERYKTKDRLQWEQDFDCIELFKQWIIENSISTENELDELRKNIKKEVSKQKNNAWKAYQAPIQKELQQALSLLNNLINTSTNGTFIKPIKDAII